MNRWHNSFL